MSVKDTMLERRHFSDRTYDVPDARTPWDLYTQRNRAAFLAVLFLVGASNYLDRSIIGVLLEPIKMEFQVSDTMLGLLSGVSFALFYATLGLPVARWADRGDRTLIITISLAIWSAMTALCGLAGTFWQLMLARFGVGAGEAGAIPPAQSLIADYYPPAHRARAMGIFTMSSAAGYALGLVLGGFIAEHYGWRAAFIIAGVSGLALAPFARFVLKEPRHQQPFAPGRQEAEATGAALRALAYKRSYLHILAAMVIYFIMSYGALVFIVSLMVRVHGLNAAQAGGTFGGIWATGAVIGSGLGGVLADRFAARDIRRLASFSGWGLIASLPAFELALAAPNIVVMSALLLLSTVLYAAAVPAMFSALHVVCGSSRRAFAVAIGFFFANLIGLSLGPLATGVLSDAFGRAHGTGDGLRYAMMLMVAVLLPAGASMLRAAAHLNRDAEP